MSSVSAALGWPFLWRGKAIPGRKGQPCRIVKKTDVVTFSGSREVEVQFKDGTRISAKRLMLKRRKALRLLGAKP